MYCLCLIFLIKTGDIEQRACTAKKAKVGKKKMASILAIGTANPPNCFDQADYPDFYFRVTKSEHMTQLKDKFKRICKQYTCMRMISHLRMGFDHSFHCQSHCLISRREEESWRVLYVEPVHHACMSFCH